MNTLLQINGSGYGMGCGYRDGGGDGYGVGHGDGGGYGNGYGEGSGDGYEEDDEERDEPEAVSGLVNMGYREDEAREATQRAKNKLGENASTPQILKEALRLIGSRL
jgi:hypothetical protein